MKILLAARSTSETNLGEFRDAETGEEQQPEHDLVLDVGGGVDGVVEPAEFLVGEEMREMAAAGRASEAQGATGDLGGFNKGGVVDPVAAGGVDEFTDEGLTHFLMTLSLRHNVSGW